MALDRRFLYWGTFFVAAGVVLLAAQAVTLDNAFFDAVWRLWPVAIIAIGAAILLRRTRFAVAGGVLAAAMPGVLLGGLIAVAPNISVGCERGAPASYSTDQGTFDGPAAIDLTLRCGAVTVTSAPGNGWNLETGNTRNIDANVVVSPGRLSVDSGRGHGWFVGGRDDWRLTLPTATRLDVNAEVDAGQGRLDMAGAVLGTMGLRVNAAEGELDLTNATVDHLSVHVNAGSTDVRLPAADDLTGDLSVNAGSLKVCAPAGTGVRVQSDVSLGSGDYNGLVRNGGVWESPDYATAAHHIDLTASVNLGSIVLNPAGGCK